MKGIESCQIKQVAVAFNIEQLMKMKKKINAQKKIVRKIQVHETLKNRHLTEVQALHLLQKHNLGQSVCLRQTPSGNS